MARKLNKTVVGVLAVLAIFTVVVVGVVVVSSLPGRDPARYVAEAEKAEAAGEFDRATKLYWRAHQADSTKNPDLVVRAGRAALEDDKAETPVAGALYFINQALVMNPSLESALEFQTELRFELAKITGGFGDWSALSESAEKLIEADEGSALGHHALGAAKLAMVAGDGSQPDTDERYKPGKESLEDALELDPTNVEIVRRLTTHYLGRAQTAGGAGYRSAANDFLEHADDLVSRTVEQCGGDPERLVDARLLESEVAIIKTGLQFLSTEEKDKSRAHALSVLEALAGAGAERLQCHRLLMLFNATPKTDGGEVDYEKAVEHGETALRALEQKLAKRERVDRAALEIYFQLAAYYTRSGRSADVADLYESGLKVIEYRRHFRSWYSNRVRARLLYQLFRFDLVEAAKSGGDERKTALASAERRFEQISDELGPDKPFTIMVNAFIENARGNTIQAIQLAEEADQTAGTVIADLKLLLGELYSRTAQWGSAQKALVSLLVEPSSRFNMPAHRMLGRVYLQLQHPENTIALLKPAGPPLFRRTLLNDYVATQLRLAAYEKLGQYENAEEENQQLAQLGDDPWKSRLRQALLLLEEKKYARAEAILLRDPTGETTPLADEAPVREKVVRAALEFFRRTGRKDDARAFIDSMLDREPDNRALLGLKLAVGGAEGATASDEEVEAYYRGEKDPFARATGLAQWYISRGDLAKAVPYLDEAERLRPDHGGILERQFVVALQTKDFDRAKRYAVKHTKINLDGTEGNISYGRLAAARGDLDRAVELMTAGLNIYGNYSLGHTFLAEIYVAARRISEAKSRLDRALELDPTNGAAHRLMAQIAANDGDGEAEARHTRLAARTIPNDPWVKSHLRLLNERRDPRAGIVLREETRRSDPTQFENLVRLARLYRHETVADQDKSAEVYLEALSVARADSDRDDVSLVREIALAFGTPEMGRAAEGEELLRDGLGRTDDVSQKAKVSMNLALFYERQGRRSSAEREVRIAVVYDPSPVVLQAAAEMFARMTAYREAIRFYELAMNSSPEDPRTIHARIISLLFQILDLERAGEEVEKFVEAFPDDPQGLIFKGTYHMMGGNMDKAEAAFRKELEIRPRNAVALWQRGQLYALKRRWQPAIDDLQSAKAERPDGFNYRHRIALAECLLEAERGPDAVLELQSILNDGQDRDVDRSSLSEVSAALVSIYSDARVDQIEKANHLIHTFMSDQPNDERWPLRLARLGERTGDWNKAVDGYERAVEISQYRPQLVEGLFRALRNAGRPDEIIRVAEEKLSARRLGSMPRALASLGWAYAQKEKHTESWGAYRAALTAAASDFQTHSIIISEMNDTFGKEKVRADFESVGPDDVVSRKILLTMLIMDSDLENAMQAAQDVLAHAKLDSDREFAHMALAHVREATGEFEKAREEYEAALGLNPRNLIVLNNLAFLLSEKLNRPTEALPYAEQAAKIRPDVAEVQDTLGQILARNGRSGEALTALLHACQLDRNHFAAVYHVGIVYKDKGDLREAKEWLERGKRTIEAQISAGGSKSKAADDARSKYLSKIEKALDELGA